MKKRRIIISFSAIIFILIITVASLFAVSYLLNGKFQPGTSVASLDVSNLTPTQAYELLNHAQKEYQNNKYSFTLNNKTISLSPKELGIEILSNETIGSIQQINNNKFGFASVLDMVFPENTETNIAVLSNIDKETLINTLEKEFDLNNIKPQDAYFYLDEDGVLNIQKEENGFVLNHEEIYKKIKTLANDLQTEKIKLSLNEAKPEISKEMLLLEEESVLLKLNHKLTLVDPIYSDPWYIKLADYPEWVLFEHNGEETDIKIVQEELNKYVDEKISKWLDLPPENVNIYSNEDGSVTIEGRGNDGKKVQRELFKEAIEKALIAKAKEVVVPIRMIKPTITVSKDLQKLGISERIAIGHSSYYGSPTNRLHNIKVGSSKFNGLLVGPGQEFSFNTNLGRVDGTTGYRKELVIKSDGTKPEYGGGICQVSTTMYRTILDGGFPVTARSPHSYAVSYYSQTMGHGLDATIYLGGADLKFVNDTDSHLLIQAYTQNDYELYFVFYGTSPGRHVELEGPYLSGYRKPGATVYVSTDTLPPGTRKQVEKSHTGFRALWYRHITYDNGETITETLNTIYRAIPAKILIGAETGNS